MDVTMGTQFLEDGETKELDYYLVQIYHPRGDEWLKVAGDPDEEKARTKLDEYTSYNTSDTYKFRLVHVTGSLTVEVIA